MTIWVTYCNFFCKIVDFLFFRAIVWGMSRIEDLNEISDICANAQKAREQKEQADRNATQKLRDEENRKIDSIQKPLRDTGVVGLLSSVCEKGIKGLRESDLVLDRTKPRAFLNFNFRQLKGGMGHDHINVFVENGVLVIVGNERYVVEKEMTMAKAIGLALANPEVVLISDRSWGV